MDGISSIEMIQAHLNLLEILYQKSLNQRIYPYFFVYRLKKLNFLKNLIFLYDIKKSINFFDEYFEKIWYFLPSFSNIHSWIFFWAFNSFDMLLKNKIKFSKKKIQFLLNMSLFSFSRYGYLFNNSYTILSLYAGTMAYLCTNEKPFILNRIYSVQIYLFLKKLKNKKGSIQSFLTGESDSRMNYCILTICSLYNILTIEISKDSEYHIFNIQMKDGSFSENKSREGHGSFFYCCISSLLFFSRKYKNIVIPICSDLWLFQKEKFFDFSFQGRCAKLTDCCYYFWIGASFILTSLNLPKQLFNGLIFSKGKLKPGYSDKIGRSLDLYHSCYALCGFSILNFKKSEQNSMKELKKSLIGKSYENIFTSKLNPVYGIREFKLLFFFTNSII